MTVINNKSISGITSINAQSNSLELFNNAGVSLLDLNNNSVTFSGNVGIGTDNPSSILSINSSAPIITFTDNDNGLSAIINASSGNLYYDTATAARDHIFRGSGTEVVRITGDGSTGIGTDTPAEILTVAGNVRIENSTDAAQYLNLTYQGINFQNTGAGSSTTSSAHLLDDYEEGTWTPGVEGLVTPGTYTVAAAVGTYTKIGNQVTIVGRIDTITETVAGSSSVQITGLPFASANYGVYSIGTIELSNWNIDNATNSLNTFALNNATKLYIRETRDGLAIANVNLADLVSGSSSIRLTMTYLTN